MKERKRTKAQFREDFKRGLGRSYIELKESKSREKFKDVVLWACLRNTCYDMQCEGGRGIYLYRAICLYEDKCYFEDAIIRKYRQKNLDSWLFSQLCELLYLFAEDGSVKAKEILYEKYNTLLALLSAPVNRTVVDNFEWLCVWLTSLDGFSAFKSIVKQVGAVIIKESYPLNMDWFYSNAKNKFGEKRIDAYLQKSAIKLDHVEAFLSSVAYPRMYNKQDAVPPTAEDMIRAAKKKQGLALALCFSKVATEDDLLTLAKCAMEETDLEIQLQLLWVFRKVRFPLDERLIFELAECADPSIRDVAFEMMEHLPSPMIHDYAIKRINQKKELGNALSLLSVCYRSEDENVLLEGIQSLTVSYDSGEWHGVYMNVEKLIENRSVKINSSVFVYMYRQTLCSYCRHSLLKQMSKRKALSQAMLEECLYDSYEDTRRFAMRKLRMKA